MLKGPAQTFRSRGRLAVGLSWVAGYTNVVMLLAAGQTVSHQTGNATHLGEQVGRAFADRGAAGDAAYFAALVAAFGVGAFAAGVATDAARRAGRRSRFVLPMTAEAILLSVVVLLTLRWPLPRGGVPRLAVTLTAAAAMGLQNGTITRISGAVVRTTHLTGVVTDLGLELAGLAAGWRRRRPSWRRLGRQPGAQRAVLLAAIFATFLTGAVLGTVAYGWHDLGTAALCVPVLFLAALVVREQTAAIAEIRPGDVPPDLAAAVPDHVGLFRLVHRNGHRNGRRDGRRDHPPDWARWAESVPARWRVVVLSVDPLTRFHAEAAVGLLAAMSVLRQSGRTLLVVGLGRPQLRLLRRHAPGRRLKWADFPPDLEFAVARAISVSPDPGDGVQREAER